MSIAGHAESATCQAQSVGGPAERAADSAQSVAGPTRVQLIRHSV